MSNLVWVFNSSWHFSGHRLFPKNVYPKTNKENAWLIIKSVYDKKVLNKRSKRKNLNCPILCCIHMKKFIHVDVHVSVKSKLIDTLNSTNPLITQNMSISFLVRNGLWYVSTVNHWCHMSDWCSLSTIWVFIPPITCIARITDCAENSFKRRNILFASINHGIKISSV